MNGCSKTLLTSAMAVMILASPTWAQNGSFDGSSRAAASAQAEQNLNVSCGAQTGNLIRTENAVTNFTSTAFATLPGSGVTAKVPRFHFIEPPRVFRRLFRLSHAAMAGSSSMA